MSATPQDVQDWLAQEWNTQAYAVGLRAMSIGTAANITGRLATQQYVQKAVAQPEKYGLEPVYYASLEEAKQNVAKRSAGLKVR